MKQTEKAHRLGISANYLSQIYHGKRCPGWKLVSRWINNGIIKRSFAWWQSASVSKVQKEIDSVR